MLIFVVEVILHLALSKKSGVLIAKIWREGKHPVLHHPCQNISFLTLMSASCNQEVDRLSTFIL